jgi:hypothetical protein
MSNSISITSYERRMPEIALITGDDHMGLMVLGASDGVHVNQRLQLEGFALTSEGGHGGETLYKVLQHQATFRWIAGKT